MANWNEATIQEFHAKAGKGVGSFGDRLMCSRLWGREAERSASRR